MHSDYKTISDMMDNKTSGIKFETIEKLCILLDCTPNDIFKIENESPKKQFKNLRRIKTRRLYKTNLTYQTVLPNK